MQGILRAHPISILSFKGTTQATMLFPEAMGQHALNVELLEISLIGLSSPSSILPLSPLLYQNIFLHLQVAFTCNFSLSYWRGPLCTDWEALTRQEAKIASRARASYVSSLADSFLMTPFK